MIHLNKPKTEISDKEKFVLSTNHNYFIRDAIATAANLIIVFFLISILSIIFISVGSLMSTSKSGANLLIVSYALAGLLYIVYTIFLVVKLIGIINMHEKITKIEDSFFKNTNDK